MYEEAGTNGHPPIMTPEKKAFAQKKSQYHAADLPNHIKLKFSKVHKTIPWIKFLRLRELDHNHHRQFLFQQERDRSKPTSTLAHP